MLYFREEQGRHVFRSSEGVRTGKMFSIAMAWAAAFPAVVLLALFLLVDDIGSDSRIWVIIAVLLFTIPVDIMLLLAVRKRVAAAGTVTVDYVRGLVTCSRTGMNFGRMKLRTDEISGIELAGEGVPGYSSASPAGRYRIMAVTDDGSHDIIRMQDREEALAAAGELASLLSLKLRDLT